MAKTKGSHPTDVQKIVRKMISEFAVLPVEKVVKTLIKKLRGKKSIFTPHGIIVELQSETAASVAKTLLLLASKPVSLLDHFFVFFDKAGNDFTIPDQEMKDILSDGEFFHPETGARVKDFAHRIHIFYQSNNRLEQLARVGLEVKSKDH